MEATGVKLKRTKCRKTLLYMKFLLAIAMGGSLLHCSMDDFLKVNETRIKVVVLIRKVTLKFDVPVEKKSYQ